MLQLPVRNRWVKYKCSSMTPSKAPPCSRNSTSHMEHRLKIVFSCVAVLFLMNNTCIDVHLKMRIFNKSFMITLI